MPTRLNVQIRRDITLFIGWWEVKDESVSKKMGNVECEIAIGTENNREEELL